MLLFLIVYFTPISSRDRFTFLLCESYGHNLKYVVTRNARACVSNYPQTLMKLTLSSDGKRYIPTQSPISSDRSSNWINRTSSIVQAAYKRKFKSTNERYEGPNEHVIAAARINSKRTSSGQAFCCCTLAQSATRKGSLIRRIYVCKTMIILPIIYLFMMDHNWRTRHWWFLFFYSCKRRLL